MVSETFLHNDDCNEALALERIIGVETGDTAIREDASINLEAVARLNRRFENLDLVRSNLAAIISRRRLARSYSICRSMSSTLQRL